MVIMKCRSIYPPKNNYHYKYIFGLEKKQTFSILIFVHSSLLFFVTDWFLGAP